MTYRPTSKGRFPIIMWCGSLYAFFLSISSSRASRGTVREEGNAIGISFCVQPGAMPRPSKLYDGFANFATCCPTYPLPTHDPPRLAPPTRIAAVCTVHVRAPPVCMARCQWYDSMHGIQSSHSVPWHELRWDKPRAKPSCVHSK